MNHLNELFFRAPKTYVKNDGLENISILRSKMCLFNPVMTVSEKYCNLTCFVHNLTLLLASVAAQPGLV